MKKLVLAFLCAFGPVLCIAECPGGVDWIEYKSTCFLFSSRTRNWLDAEGDCKKYDARGTLASIDTAQKMSFISNILKVLSYLGHGSHWIGSSDYAIEGQFRWIKTGLGVNYFNWADGEPDGLDTGNEDCIAVQNYNGTFLWNDVDCFKSHYWYICETPVSSGNNGPVIG